MATSFPAAEEAKEKRVADENFPEEESAKTSIQAMEQSPAIPLPAVLESLLKKSEEEEGATALVVTEEKAEEEESKVRKISPEPRETELSEQHAEMLSTASELQTVSPVPIQVAESVLEASPKESVSRDLPEGQSVLSTTVTPVHESLGVATPLKFEMNGSERLDPVSVSEKEEKELEIPERPTRARELNIPATPTVTEATPPTSPPVLIETPSLQETSNKSEEEAEVLKKSEEEDETVKKSKEEAQTVKKSEEETETVKQSEEKAEPVKKSEEKAEAVKKFEEEAETMKKSEQEPETPEGDIGEKKTKKTTKKVVKKMKSKSEEGQEEAAEGSSAGSKQKKTVKVTRKGSKGFLGAETTVPETPPPGGSSKDDAPVPPKRKPKTTAKSNVQKKSEQSE